MNTNFLVIRFTSLLLIASGLLASCDDEVSDVGSGALIGNDLSVVTKTFDVTINQVAVPNPRTNNLNYYLLGDQSNGFENTKYGIVTRLLGLQNPPENLNTEDEDDEGTFTITKNKIISATLAIPYVYTNEEDDENSDSVTDIYSISNIIKGSSNLDLSVYNLNFLLQDTGININTTQEYFADGSEFSSTNKINLDLERATLISTSETDDEIELPSTESDEENPRFAVNLFDDEENEPFESFEINQNLGEIIKIPLNQGFVDYLNTLIDIDEDGVDDISIFSNQEFYTEHLKSIYITSNTTTGGLAGVMAANSIFYRGGIELLFQTDKQVTVDGVLDIEESTPAVLSDDQIDEWRTTSTLLFTTNPINIFTKEESNPNFTNTNQSIVLQSGIGSVANVILFEGNEELLDENNEGDNKSLFERNILLNDAVLRLTVDTSIYDGLNLTNEELIAFLPENIMISELDTGSILSDYSNNFSSNDEDFESLKEGHLMSLVIPENGLNPYYEINLTEHVANILDQDSSFEAIEQNTTLALSITNDLGIISSSKINNNVQEFVNQGSLLSFKTISLFGSNAVDQENKPLLTIKYTSTGS